MSDDRLDAQYLDKIIKQRDQKDVQDTVSDPLLRGLIRSPQSTVPDMTGFVNRVAEKLRIGEPDIKPLIPDYQPQPLQGVTEDQAGTLTGKQKPPEPSAGEAARLVGKGLKSSVHATGQLIENTWKFLGDASELLLLDRSALDYIQDRVAEGNKLFEPDDPDYAYKLFHHIFLGVGQAIGDVARYAGGTKVFNNVVAAFAFIDGMIAYGGEDWMESAEAAAKGAGLGTVLHAAGPLKLRWRMPTTATIFGGLTAAEGGDTNQILASGFTGAWLGAMGGRGRETPSQVLDSFTRGVPRPSMVQGPLGEAHLKELFPGKGIEVEAETGDFLVGLPEGPLRVSRKAEVSLPVEKGDLPTHQAKILEEGGVVPGFFRAGQLEDLVTLASTADPVTLRHEAGHLFFKRYGTPEEKATLLRAAERYADANPEKYPEYDGSIESAEDVAVDMIGMQVLRVPESALSKLYQEVGKYFGTAESIRARIRKGEAWEMREERHRPGVPKIPGESHTQYMIRIRQPEYYNPPERKKDGTLKGAAESHKTPQARGAMVRKLVGVTSEAYRTNPEWAYWYEDAGTLIRDIFNLKEVNGEWTGNIKGANTFIDLLAIYSPQMPVKRNLEVAIRVLGAIAKGEEFQEPGAVASAKEMTARVWGLRNAEELSTKERGVGEKVDSFGWDLKDATFLNRNPKNVTLDSLTIRLMGLTNSKGNPMESLKGKQYAWGRDVWEEVTRRFNQRNGTDFDPRNIQALGWGYERGSGEGFHTYLQEGAIPPEVAAAKYEIRGPRGEDVTSRVREIALSESRPITNLRHEDRAWLFPDGRALMLGPFDIHSYKAGDIFMRAGVDFRGPVPMPYEFGGPLGAIRVHGPQKTYRWTTGKELALEVFGPLSKQQKEIIKTSLGKTGRIIADVTNPKTGEVVTYAEGKGEAGFRALDRAVKRVFHGIEYKRYEVRLEDWKEDWSRENAKGEKITNYTNRTEDLDDPLRGYSITLKEGEDLAQRIADKEQAVTGVKASVEKAEDYFRREAEKYADAHPDRPGKDIPLGTERTRRVGNIVKTEHWDGKEWNAGTWKQRLKNRQTIIDEGMKAEVRFPGPKGMRLDKMFSLEEPGMMDRVKDLVRQDWSEIDAQRRETVSFDEAYEKAEELIASGKFGFQDFLHHPAGKNWPTPEHGIAARMYASNAWQTFADAQAAFEAGNMTEAQLGDYMAVAEAAGRVAYGGTAETGRTLAFYRAPVLSSGRTWTPEEMAGVSRFMQGLRASGESVSEVAARLTKLSPRQLAKLSADLEPPGAWDMFTEVWINSLLSNPATHAANALSNLTVLTGLVAERTMAGAARETINGVRRAFGGERVEGVYVGEAGAMLQAALEGFTDSLLLAAHTVKTGESKFGVGKVEGRQDPAVTVANMKELANRFTDRLAGKKMMDPSTITWMGRAFDFVGDWVIRGPGKGLLAGDEFFKTINYRMEIAAQAYRKSMAGEGKGADVAERYQYLKENPTSEMKSTAFEFAKYATFTDSGGRFTQAIMGMREAHPTLRLVLPFVKTPSRIAHFSFQRMPLINALSKQLRADLKGEDPVRRDLAIAKVGSSALATAAVAAMVAAGSITGGGPRDRKMKELYRAQGWMPYSIRIPGTNHWVTYDRLDPVGQVFASIANFVELKASMNPEEGESDIDSIPVAIVLAFSEAFVNKTYMQGFSNAIASVTDPGRSGGKFLRGFTGSLVPSVVGGFNRNLFDSYIREVETFGDSIRNRVPGYSDTLSSRKDPWGNPSLNHGWGMGIFLPFRHSKWEEDPASQELINLGISVPKMSKYFGGGAPPLPMSVQKYFVKDTRKYGVKWDDDEYDELMRAYGNGLKIDWSSGSPEVVGFGTERGDGMHDYLNKVITDKVDLPLAISDPEGNEVTKYSQLPPAIPGVPGEDLRSIVLRMIMHSYKSITEEWYLDYQARRAKEKGKKSMRQTQVEREGEKAIRKGAPPEDVRRTVEDIIPQIGR
jgi:hypothetical protein